MTELLVVIGVLVMLMALTLMVVNKARNSARAARLKQEMQTITAALEVYKNQVNGGRGYPVVLHSSDPTSAKGSYVLARWLIGPGPANEDGYGVAQDLYYTGIGNFGYRLSPTTPIIEPILAPDRFKVVRIAAGQWAILDSVGNEIQYYPRRPASGDPSITLLVGPVGTNAYAYDQRDGDVAPQMLRFLLGDENMSNRIEPSEKLRYSGEFILASPGPDKEWTPASGNIRSALNDSDDVFNFDR